MFKKQHNNIESSKGFTTFSLHERGFTLIELIVVIAIVGILTTLAVANVASSIKRARDSERINSLKQLQTALELYYQDHGSYPSTGTLPPFKQWRSGRSGGFWIPELTAKYIKEMPLDPKNGSGCSADAGDGVRDGATSCYDLAYYAGDFCSLELGGYMLATRLEANDTIEFSRKNIINPTTGTLCQKDCSLDENGQTVPTYNVTTWAECPVKGLYVVVNP